MNSKQTTPPPLPKPEKPLKDDCCGSGCAPCIWDIYYDELEAWREAEKADDMKTTDKIN